jgi:hypothetical protein
MIYFTRSPEYYVSLVPFFLAGSLISVSLTKPPRSHCPLVLVPFVLLMHLFSWAIISSYPPWYIRSTFRVLLNTHRPRQVKNKAAKAGGLDVSLFRRLSDAHPHAVVDLAQQYRMNEDIMTLSNKLIYGDRLRCGSEKIARQSLVLPDRTFLHSLHSGISSCHPAGCWMEKLMAEK